jgi:hypothetical protein
LSQHQNSLSTESNRKIFTIPHYLKETSLTIANFRGFLVCADLSHHIILYSD